MTRFSPALSFATCLVAAGVSLAPVTAAAGEPSDVPAIAHERYKLDNGLEVILHQDRRVPIVAIDVWYHVGSGNEVPGKSGFAHLFEHMMFQGAKHIGSDVHFDVLRKIGASEINGTTNPDRTNYFEVVPSHQIETALWLESDRMGYLLDLVDEKSLKNQIEVVRNERRQRYDNVPFGKERFVVAEALYGEGHPYRYLTIGRHEDLDGASLPDVHGFFKHWYVPSNATLVLAGDFETADAKALVTKWFGAFPSLPRPVASVAAPTVPAATVRREVDDAFARFPRVHYVWYSPPNLGTGDAELDILASVLGSDGWGRLSKQLVIEKRLARSVGVYQFGQGFSGEFHLVVDMHPGKDRNEVETLLKAELDRIAREPLTEAEIQRAKNDIEAQFVWRLESVFARAEQLQYFNHYTGDPSYAGKMLGIVRSRTPADVQKVAAAVFAKPRVEVLTNPAKAAAPAAAAISAPAAGKPQ